jgi:REP element-mobilizing transposase RayT
LDYPDALHHVIVRGIARKYIFETDRDKERFLTFFGAGLAKSGCRCYAWCLMGNHAHFLIRSSDKGLAPLMRSVLTRYALWYNKVHRRSGHLFQNRYKSILIQADSYFLELVRYIHLNPVRARMVKSLKALASYPWTGHATMMGRQDMKWQQVEEVLCRFENNKNLAMERYQAFVKEGLGQKGRNYSQGGLLASAGGLEGLRQLQKDGQRWAFDARVLGDGAFVLNATKLAQQEMDKAAVLKLKGWDCARAAKAVAEVYRYTGDFFKRRGRADRCSRARAAYARFVTELLGVPRKVAALQLGVTRQAIGQAIFRSESDVEFGLLEAMSMAA